MAIYKYGNYKQLCLTLLMISLVSASLSPSPSTPVGCTSTTAAATVHCGGDAEQC